MKPVIRIEKAVKRFGKQLALDDVSFDIPSGVVCGLVGENGAGKSTTIKALLGLVELDSGSSEVLGLDSKHEGQEIRRKVGYVSERPSLYDWMTVYEIGWFAAGFYPKAFLENYRKQVADFELPEDRKIKHLSKGMRAKVSLALALAHEPELLILDEPTSGLDPIVRREFLESIVELAAAGRTVLISSHQIAEIERVADSVAVLAKGKLLLFEEMESLKSKIRELTITTAEAMPSSFALPGLILSEQRRPKQLRAMLRDIDEVALDKIRGQVNVQEIDIRCPSLEEVVVALLKQTKPVEGEVRP